MFSQELEDLIQATLEDGTLEDYEKAALVKRAQAEGVDLTELEIYINSILQKRQKELEKEKSEKMARIAKEKKEALLIRSIREEKTPLRLPNSNRPICVSSPSSLYPIFSFRSMPNKSEIASASEGNVR